jgi:alpha-amylase
MAGRFAVGEYFDGSPSALNWWVWNSGMGGRCNVFDFTLHWTIQAMCNNSSRWNMSGLQGAGYIAVDPTHAVTFVDNPDTDSSPGENVIWNKLLGYALILTAEGYPAVYYKDYSTDQGCYGLKSYIDNLIWIHENLAFGNTATRWTDEQVYVFERQGYPGLLVALNNDGGNSYTRTVQTNLGAYVQLHDYTGKHRDILTNSQGMATFTIPRNVNGQSYLCFSRTGYRQGFAINQRTTTQTFVGAPDLDVSPVTSGHYVLAGRIWCQGATNIECEFKPDTDGWSTTTEVILDILDPEGKSLASHTYKAHSPNQQLSTKANQSGWFTLRLTGSGLPSSGTAYQLTVTYTGTQELNS